MFKALLRTPNEFAMTLVRVGLGASMLPHGLAKLGLFGPEWGSIEGTQAMVTGLGLGLPGWTAWLLIATEVVGAGFLILGFLGRFAALAMAVAMGVAAWTKGGLAEGAWQSWWLDHPAATSYGSYHILAVACALAILIRGSGALSIDRRLARPPSAL